MTKLQTIDFIFQLSDLGVVCIHLLAIAILVLVNPVYDKSRITENQEPFYAKLDSYIEVV